MNTTVYNLTDFIKIIEETSQLVKNKNQRGQGRWDGGQKPPLEVLAERDQIILEKKKYKHGDYKYESSFVEKNKDFFYEYYSRERQIKNDHYEMVLFFRGQANVDYRDRVCPGIYRRSERHDEQYYLNNMNLRCPQELKGLNSINRLTFLQHYGCPTRMLDVTTNPLVALFFACERDLNCDGEVFVFGINEADVLYSRSDRVIMLSKLPEMDKDQQRKLRTLAYLYIDKDKFPQSPNHGYSNPVVEQFYHTIRMDYPAFERLINPIDLLSPIFVYTELNNPRILKQDGAFLMSGLDYDEADSNKKIREYIRNEIIIPKDRKRHIIDELEMVSITQATLFPEVDKVSAYLKNKQ